jgi:hypothetical protein
MELVLSSPFQLAIGHIDAKRDWDYNKN